MKSRHPTPTSDCQLNHYLFRICLHPDGLCDQCKIPDTVEHFIEVCSKYSEARQRLQHALNQIGVTFETPQILRSTAAAKLVETFVRESGKRILIPLSGPGNTRPRSQ